MTARKALIICLGAIGDVTRALPLAVRLKRFWPETELHWAVEPISRSIVEGHPALAKVIAFDRPRGFPAYREFVRTLRAERYDLVLDLQRHFKSGVTSFSTGAPERIGFARQNSREGNWLFNTRHIPPSDHLSSKVLQFQKFGDALGLPPLEPLDFGLQPSAAERAALLTKLEEAADSEGIALPERGARAALILGSTWPSRFWRAESYGALIRELLERRGMVSVLVGGPHERLFAEAVRRAAGVPTIQMVERTTLRELVPLFAEVRLAVGSDSGPMHIAAAVGTPVVSLWGSTSPKRSAPWGCEEHVLQSPIGCSPCYRKRCPGLNTLCMSSIPWQAVALHADRILGAEPR